MKETKSEDSISKEINFSERISEKTEKERKNLVLEYFRKQTRKTYSGLFKDLEITKGQFITLYLIFLSFTSVLLIDIMLTLTSIEARPGTDGLAISVGVAPGTIISLGMLIGFLFGGFLVDRIERRYPLLLKLMFISIIVTIAHVAFFRRTGEIVPSALFFTNSFVAGILFMLFLTFFADFTSVLERGRVFSYLLIILTVSLGILIALVATLLLVLPAIILIISFIYFYRNREQEEPIIPIIEASKKEINFTIVKYIVILGFFNLAIGLFIPAQEIETIGATQWSGWAFALAILIAIIASVSTTITVGLMFDFSGRRAAISYIILAISIVNFIRLFNVNVPYFDLAIILAAFLASFICVPLFMSDIARRENLGKVLGISFTIILFCILLGFALEYYITRLFEGLFTGVGISVGYAQYTGEIFLIGVVNFASIISLFFLIHTKETVSSKEQNWPDYLIHLYVIHESGVLIYDYPFLERSDAVEADLASGGITGLIAILQEITKEQKLRVIDHGGKKILFGFDSHRTLTFALLIKEELLILRNKLNYFIKEIEDKYPISTEEFGGVVVEIWKKRIDPILEKYFKRKFFELVPDLALILK